MNKTKVFATSLTLLTLTTLTFVPATFAKDNGNNTAPLPTQSEGCKNSKNNPHCTISVPEFGVVPGTIAAVSSFGAYLALRKKKYSFTNRKK